MSLVDRIRHAFDLTREKHPDFTRAASEEALVQILYEMGGEQVMFPRTTQGRAGRPQIAVEVQLAAQRDAIEGSSQVAVAAKHGISRTTLYRLVKRSQRSE